MSDQLPTFDDDDWIDPPKVVSEKTNLSPITLLRMRQEPDCGGLPWVRLSANRIGYGQELIDDVRTIIADQTADLQRRVEEGNLQQRRNGVMSRLDIDPVIGGLWRSVNSEQIYVDWLNEIDPLMGQALMPSLHQAFDSGDADRVRAIFIKYLIAQRRLPPEAAVSAQSPGAFMKGGPAPSASPSQRVPAGQRTWGRPPPLR